MARAHPGLLAVVAACALLLLLAAPAPTRAAEQPSAGAAAPHHHVPVDVASVPGLSHSQRPRLWCMQRSNVHPALDDTWYNSARDAIGTNTLVSAPRMVATAYLTKAALMSAPGDIVETGVWRGGSFSLMARAVAHFDTCERRMWAFDSFQGLPDVVTEDTKGHASMIEGGRGQMAAPRDAFEATVKAVVGEAKAQEMFDSGRIIVRPGWFNETTKAAEIEQISFLRLDGDLFVSTWDPLVNLYDKVSPGGFIYVDDYGSFKGCHEAVNRFRLERRIYETMHWIREPAGSVEAVWWQKARV